MQADWWYLVAKSIAIYLSKTVQLNSSDLCLYVSSILPRVDVFASFLGHEDEVKFVNRDLNFLSWKMLPSIIVRDTSLPWQNFETNEANLQNMDKSLTNVKYISITSFGKAHRGGYETWKGKLKMKMLVAEREFRG